MFCCVGLLTLTADSLEKTLCWEGLRAGGEGDDRGWDGWNASLTQCTWVWADSGSWWRTGRAGMLQFMGSQRVGHDWVTELELTDHCKSFPGGSVVKNPPANAGDMGSLPGPRRAPGKGKGSGLQYSCLGNPTDSGAWHTAVHGAARELDTT